MAYRFRVRILSAAALSTALILTTFAPAAAAVTIIVNGQQVQFDQPPIERSGRVFVPLRGVFERLGASVVYDNGVINATGNGRSVQLHIGSTTAVVNGSNQMLDVAPFLVGARTLVPLRFISQALGASVNYDNNSQTVTVSLGSGSSNVPPAEVTLTNLRPGSDAVVAGNRPAVGGNFSTSVDPNSVHITLDGRDVSATSDISSTDFLFSPQYDLTPERHTVRITGKTSSGQSFDQSWAFTSGTSLVANYVHALKPVNGSTVGNSFTVSGTTLPGSSVHIVAIPTAIFGGVFRVQSGTYTADVTADGSGHFSQDVNVQTVPGGNVAVRITSIAPTTKQSVTVDLNLKS
ncbi:MAG: copper amine oxidase N-terminal domain-containing protein [Candidatus Eremiobacteraeota bacterium]|nr:copper amine oxidase N-terminal domain-containing protein [Candidatus Eremiobacteraeota bacterium]